MKRSFSRLFLIAFTVFLAGGCGTLQQWKTNDYAVGPNYTPPEAKVTSEWIDADSPALVPKRGEVVDWWKGFDDPVLEQLILAAYQQNLSLRAASLRILQAREQLALTRRNQFPQSQTASLGYTRNRLSANSANFMPGLDRSITDFRTSFDVGWELDLWGRLRRAIEAGEAAIAAERATTDDLLVTLIGDVAEAYIQLRSLDEQLDLAERNVEVQSGSLQIAQSRNASGRGSKLDVEQAKTNLADTQASIPFLRLQRRTVVNGLALLLGMTPRELEPHLRQRAPLPTVPPQMTLEIPADLIRRRPDIRAAEHRVAAQSAQIGIATADLFPQFSLGGSIGFSAEDVGDLLAGRSTTATFAPGFKWNILNYGQIKKNIAIEDLRFQEAVANYQNVVLAAQREVEDAIISFIESKKQLVERRKSARAAMNSVRLVNAQYREGQVDFGRVFVLQSAMLGAQNNLVATQANIATAMIRAYKAMGGGWQLRLDIPYAGSYDASSISGSLVSSDPLTRTSSGSSTPSPAISLAFEGMESVPLGNGNPASSAPNTIAPELPPTSRGTRTPSPPAAPESSSRIATEEIQVIDPYEKRARIDPAGAPEFQPSIQEEFNVVDPYDQP